jgi:hypothetical protein
MITNLVYILIDVCIILKHNFMQLRISKAASF